MTEHGLRLTAVQLRWSLDLYRTQETFVAGLRLRMVEANAGRDPSMPHLVAFPEFVGLPLVFLGVGDLLEGCASWREAVMRLMGAHAAEVQATAGRFDVGPVRALFLHLSEQVRRVYLDTFAELAAEFRCYLAAGSAPLPDPDGEPDGRIYNIACLFGPDGRVIGSQKKIYPYGLEGAAEGLEIVAGLADEVGVWDTELGRVGILVCFDAWQEDVLARMAERKPEILIQPSANAHVWDEWQAGDWERGLWTAVQRMPGVRYGVNPMMVGSLFAAGDEYACQGRSSVIAKAAQTPDGSGYLARTAEQPWSEYGLEEIVTAFVPRPGA